MDDKCSLNLMCTKANVVTPEQFMQLSAKKGYATI